MHKYTRLKVLGKGGFGEAILVEDKTSKKKYVIKEVWGTLRTGTQALLPCTLGAGTALDAALWLCMPCMTYRFKHPA